MDSCWHAHSYWLEFNWMNKDPKTPEEWTQWIWNQTVDNPGTSNLQIQLAISKAQEQVRKDAIKECLEIVLHNGYVYNLNTKHQPFAEEFNQKLAAQRKYVADKIKDLLEKT